MKVIKLAAVIDDLGNLHLDISTELSSATVDVSRLALKIIIGS